MRLNKYENIEHKLKKIGVKIKRLKQWANT